MEWCPTNIFQFAILLSFVATFDDRLRIVTLVTGRWQDQAGLTTVDMVEGNSQQFLAVHLDINYFGRH